MDGKAFNGEIPNLGEAARIWYNLPENENNFNTDYNIVIKNLNQDGSINRQKLISMLEKGQYKFYSWNGRFDNNEYLGKDYYNVSLYNQTPWNNMFFADEYSIYDIASIYKPDIHIISNETSPPIDAEWALDKSQIWVKTSNLFNDALVDNNINNIDELLSTNSMSPVEHYYLDFISNDVERHPLQSDIPPDTIVFVRNHSEPIFDSEENICDYIFLTQYWMFYSYSTTPIWEFGTIYPNVDSVPTCHGMDWEFFMVAVKASSFLHSELPFEPIGAFAAAHFYGMTLNWPGQVIGGSTKEPGEDYIIINNNRPEIYIAGGSHATFLNSRSKSYLQNILHPNPFEVIFINPNGQLAEHFGAYSSKNVRGELYPGLWESLQVPSIPTNTENLTVDLVQGRVNFPPDYLGEGRLINYNIKPIDKIALWRGRWGGYGNVPSICYGTGNLGPYGPLYRRDRDDLVNGNSFWSEPTILYDKYRKNRHHIFNTDTFNYHFQGITKEINVCE
jgi:hypothetical protein